MLYFQVFKRAFQIILLYLNKVKVATTLFQIIQYIHIVSPFPNQGNIFAVRPN